MRLLGYCRAAPGTPCLEAQARYLREWADAHRQELLAVTSDEPLVRDDGVEITSLAGIVAVLGALGGGRAEGLVVFTRAVIGRADGWLFEPAEEIEALGRHLVVLDEDVTPPTRAPRPVARRSNKPLGSGPVPFGYRRDRPKDRPARIVAHDVEAQIVRAIFVAYLRKGASVQRVADAINGRGIRTRRGAAWTRTSIAWVLRNPVYLGRVRSRDDGSLQPGPHPALVTARTFERVAAKLRAQDRGVRSAT